MQKLTLLIFFILASATLSAQQMYQRTYGGNSDENVTAMTKTADGGYALAGFTTTFGPGTAGAMLVKTDANGDTLWAKSYGHNFDEECFTVRQTFDGGYILTGYSENAAGNWDIYLIKTDSVGDTLWTRMYGGNGYEVGAFCRQLNDSGYVVAGYTNSNGSGGYDAYVLRTNSAGDTVWTTIIGGPSFFDYFNVVIPALDGGFIAVGGAEDFGPGSTDAFIVKLDDNGDTLWSKIYGLSNFEDATGIVPTQDSMYLVSGTTNSAGSGGNEAWVMKIDMNGNVIWHNGYGGTGDDRTYHIAESKASGAVIAGFTRSFGSGLTDVLAFETDSLGALVWAKTYGGSGDDWANRVYNTNDGGYVFGAIGENLGQPNNDFYLIKTDTLGNSGCNQTNPTPQVTAFTFTTANITPQINSGLPVFNNPFTVINPAIIPDTLCFMCDTITTLGFVFDTTQNTVTFTDTTNNANSWLWDFGDGNNSTEQSPTHIYASTDSTYLVCLTVYNSCDTVVVCDSITVDVVEVGWEEHLNANSLKIYPNPTKGQFSIQFNFIDEDGYASIYATNGQLIFQRPLISTSRGQTIELDVKQLQNGVYYLHYSSAKYTLRKKIIVQ